MTISPSLFKFLKDLKKNNNREWFNTNKARYEVHQSFMKNFVAALQKEMEKQDLIEKAKLYRIYRDVRFSKNKQPYKNNFGGYLRRATAQRRGGYYFHIEPNNSIVAGGFWRPNSADLKRIREEIAANDTELRNIINHSTFQKTFGSLQGEEVKTAPRGYNKEHPSIDLLRKKQFVVSRTFTDKEVTQDTFLKETVQIFQHMRPFFDYMSDILTTDSNGLPLNL